VNSWPRLAIPAVFVVCAVTGCDPGPDTNGMERLSAAEVQRAAATALKSATSAHVRSKGTIEGEPAQIDVRIQGDSSNGTVELAGTTFHLVKIGDDVYLKGPAPALAVLGVPDQVQRLAADRWLRLGASEVTALDGFTLEEQADRLTDLDSPLEPAVEQTVLDGRKAVVISQRDGSQLYVANSGTPLPLRAVRQGDTPGQVDYTEYDVHFDIAAPPDAVRFSAPDEEHRWLDSIDKVRKDIEDIYRLVGEEWELPEMTQLRQTLGRCSGELVLPEPPSVRMEAVHELVKQACQEYDKGAACFATAAENWEQSALPDRNKIVSDALECGFTVRTTGGKLLTDAETEGLKVSPPR
jgi:hypothetical protein